jgi:hypothetical protein
MEHKTLGIELDKKGSNVYIKYSDSLAYTPAYTFFIRQMADLIDSKHGRPYTSWEDDNCELIWAEIENEVVAILCYDTQYVFRKIPYIATVLAAVKENFRQRGIHAMMYRYFEKRAIDLNCLAVRSTIHLTNDVRLKSTMKDNLKPLLTTMYKKL